MPVKSKKQKKFMQAVANNPEFAKKVGVKQSIGREFTKEKSMKTKKMNMGGRTGDMMYSRGYGVGNKGKRMPTELMTAPGMKKGGKVKKDDDVSDMVKPGGTRFFDSDEVRDAKRKADKKNKKRIDKQRKELGYKAGGKVKKMRKGGNTSRMNELEELGRVDNEKAYTQKGKDNLMAEKKRVVGELKAKTGGMLARTGGSSAKMKAKGKKMMGGGKVKAYKKGGSVSSASKRADGIAQQGHTRGRMV